MGTKNDNFDGNARQCLEILIFHVFLLIFADGQTICDHEFYQKSKNELLKHIVYVFV